jgi:hypothetical protein
MSAKIKTLEILIDGDPVEVIYSGFKMGSILDSEIEVDIESIDSKPYKQCSLDELYDAAIQIDMHERKDRVYQGEFQAEAHGDEMRGN